MSKFGILSRIGGTATVGRKIAYVIGLCLALVVGVAGTGILQMQAIGVEIEGIAERDVPLTNAVTAITVHQLEQAINFERALRYGEEMKANSHARAPFEKAVHEFESLSAKVDKELKEGEALAKHAAETAATAEERAEFEHVDNLLTKIELEHASWRSRKKSSTTSSRRSCWRSRNSPPRPPRRPRLMKSSRSR